MNRLQSPTEQLIRSRVAEHPGAVWLKWHDEEYSWRDVLSATQRAADGLLELGIRPGDRVAIMLSNRPEFLWAYFGIGFIGAVPVPVNTSQRGAALSHVLADSAAVAAIVDDDLLPLLAGARADIDTLRYLVVADGSPRSAEVTLDRILGGDDREPDVEVTELGSGPLMYTSGTTGPPKGVLTSPDLTVLEAMVTSIGLKAGETLYTGLPLFHGNAMYASTLGSIILDCKLALAPRFSASEHFDDCRRHGAAMFNAVGGIATILLKQPPSDNDRNHPVHTVLCSGVPADRWREFEQRFGVRFVEWYGMVDAPGYLVNADSKVAALGRSGLAGVDFRVVDEDECPVEAGETGEIVFRHPQGRVTRYNNLPEATDKAYRGGWFHTGDLGEQDADGYFYYRGRKTLSMRRLGENISAWEIETVVTAHPDVMECAAHAVESPLGEDEVKVCVVPRPGASLDPARLLTYCREQLSAYAVPRFVEVLDHLPKTPTQRNQYGVLIERGITPGTFDSQAGRRAGRRLT